MPNMVTISKAAEMTGITYSALRRWIKSGEFRYFVRVGTKYLVNLERLAEFLDTPATLAESGNVRRLEVGR